MPANCLSCATPGLRPLLSLGRQPLANALLTAEQLARAEARYALDLAYCPGCSLVQITEVVPPEQVFRDYVYFSSYSDTMLAHARALVANVTDDLPRSSLVVEVASNDGYLLQYYKERGIGVLGIEPARNVAQVAETQRGIPTLSEFFGRGLAEQLADQGRAADVIHAHNVLAHVADPNDFVSGLQVLLRPTGRAIIEVPYVKDMIDRCEFDTIYHEHLCYFSLKSLEALLGRHRLAVVEVERVPIHGGSLRLFVSRAEAAPERPSVRALREEEAAWAATLSFYEGFARRVESLTARLRETLQRLKGDGLRLAAYGAAAKGATLLNSAGIDASVLDFVADRSPYKQGRFMPGSHIPIVPPERLLADQPDVVVILPWNLAEEILTQQAEYRRRGGRFLVPVPEIRFA